MHEFSTTKLVGNPRVIRRVYPHLCTTMWITFLVSQLSHGVLKTVFRRGESILETVFGTFSVSLAQTRKIGPQIDSLVSWFFCVFPFETPLSRLRRQIPSQRGAMRNLMSRIRCLDVSTRIRLSNQNALSESQSKKCRFRLSEALCQLVLLA